MTATIAKICLGLGCDFNDVVALNYDYNPADGINARTNNKQLWSQEEEALLIDEYNDGFSIMEIANGLNRSRAQYKVE